MIPDLLETARLLNEAGTEAARRRAISTAYYALFHGLAKLCADAIGSAGTEDDYEIVYRNIDHRTSAAALERFARQMGEKRIKDAAIIFRELQDERNRADYRPGGFDPTQAAVRTVIEKAVSGIELIETLPPAIRHSLAIALSIKSRGTP